MQRSFALPLLISASLLAAACGSSSSHSKPVTPASTPGSTQTQPAAGAGASITKAASCLQSAGYGITQVPASDVGPGGGENRGPGQTGELLVGLKGAKPTIGGDDADAVIAFWDTAAHAKSSPNAADKALGSHADAIGAVTVQPTTHLAIWAVKQGGTPAARRAAFQAQTRKIESCVS